MACDAEPEPCRGKPAAGATAASCRSCGAPIRLAGLNERQDGQWCDFLCSFKGKPTPYRLNAQYEGFDAWLLWDMYEHPDQAVPVRRKFWRREGTLPEEAGVEAG